MSWFLGHTRLVILRREVVGEDELGDPVYGTTETVVHGELVPLGGEESTAAQQQVVTRFRAFLPPTYGGLGVPKPTDALKDPEGQKYEVKGQPEPHRLGGRVHHWELIVERVTG